jgi:hypothetical protein
MMEDPGNWSTAQKQARADELAAWSLDGEHKFVIVTNWGDEGANHTFAPGTEVVFTGEVGDFGHEVLVLEAVMVGGNLSQWVKLSDVEDRAE